MNKKFSWILGCALLLLLGVGAQAQLRSDPELGKEWGLRAGFYLPIRDNARSVGGDVWFTIGAERKFYEGDRYKATFSIDYYGAGKYYNVPFQVNYRAGTGRLRYGAGAGLSLGHDLNRGVTNFAYNFLVGFNLTEGLNPISFDVRWLGTGRSDGQLDGFAFTVGMNF